MLFGRLRSVLPIVALSMVVVFGTGTAASAGPSIGTCPSGSLCLYEGAGFTGAKFSVTSLNPNGTCVSLVSHGWGDRAHSAINTHNSGAAMFMNDNCVGGPYQVPANSSLSSFGGFTPESVWVPYWNS
ncbi:peptidase inhibitor family I36 protein [Luedemannella helvata]|uniref:Peptidase inhibitor family I36 n=1 Tax=Luedemannella helvata TaxID=349315 RepID=A0ABP4VWL1_9ACTN